MNYTVNKNTSIAGDKKYEEKDFYNFYIAIGCVERCLLYFVILFSDAGEGTFFLCRYLDSRNDSVCIEIRFAFIPNKKMINTSKGFWQVIGKPNVYRIEMCVLFVMFSIFALHSFVAAIIALISH